MLPINSRRFNCAPKREDRSCPCSPIASECCGAAKVRDVSEGVKLHSVPLSGFLRWDGEVAEHSLKDLLIMIVIPPGSKIANVAVRP